MQIPFRPLSQLLMRGVHPAPIVDRSACMPFLNQLERGEIERGVMVTVNHYSAPDFQAWWRAISLSAEFPVEIHWLVAAGWRNSGWRTGLTRWLFPRGAKLFGFTAMPPMPPDPAETEQRAVAVRETLHFARSVAHPVIGITPEGADQPEGALGELPSGAGRFMLLISQSCPDILPVGVWKEDGIIHLNFGSPYRLQLEPGLGSQARDVQVGDMVMRKIAELLPVRLRGKYKG
jgi:hypothetical protein